MDITEKKALDLYKEIDHYINNDYDTFVVCRILIQEIIFELKFNHGDKQRIQYWSLVQDQLIKKYKTDKE